MDTAALDAALLERFQSRSVFHARFAFPCLPSAKSIIVKTLLEHLRAQGRALLAAEQQTLSQNIEAQLAQGRRQSPQTVLVVEVHNDAQQMHKLHFNVSPQVIAEYDAWESARTPPYFGEAPDAKAMAMAAPRVLDVGAGTGRNALPLIARGSAVDAVELHAKFHALLQQAMGARAIHGDFLDPSLSLSTYDLVLLAEVLSSHAEDPAVLESFLRRARACLAPEGRVLASIFLCDTDTLPMSPALRELGSHLLTCVFTRAELSAAAARAGLSVESDEDVVAFEKPRAKAWPPVAWFEDWARGRNLFALEAPPLSLRWIVFRAV